MLRVPMVEGPETHPIVRHEVLRGKAAPVRRQVANGDWLYRFNIKYLDRLLVTFPFAELSTGLDRRLSKQAMAEFAAMEVPEVEIPEFIGDLYDFQKIGIGACVDGLEADGYYFLNDEMGLGKTIQAICVALITGGDSVLVVTTNSGKRAWSKILKRLFPEVSHHIVEGTPDKRAVQIRDRKGITIINFEAIRVKETKVVSMGRKRKHYVPANPALFDHKYDLLVVDEFHKCKNHKSQQTTGFLQLQAEKFLLMSGTPILNNPLEYWPALHRVAPYEFPSYWAFEKNLTVKRGYKIVGYNPDAMLALREFVQGHTIRRRKDQVGVEMPKVVYSTIEVELNPEQRRLYNRIRDEFKLMLDNGEIKTIAGVLPQITRLKQACFSPELYGGSQHSAKIDELKTIVEELTKANQKAILFSQWSQATQILLREFKGYNPAYVDGSVSPKKRVLEEDRFNNDPKCQLYIGTIAANQEAITLSAATYVILTDEAWTPLANDQAIARSAAGGLRGVGTNVPVNVIRLHAVDSFEERIQDLLARKRALFNATVEKDAGAAIEKITLKDIRDLL